MAKKHKVRPPTYALVAILAVAAFNYLFPVIRIFKFPWNLLGLIPIGAGIAIELIADRAFKKAGTTIKPFRKSTALVTDGLFRFSRNPIYIGLVLMLFGIAVLFGSLTPHVAVVVFAFAMHEKFVKPEEQMLEETFGEAYREYKGRVRRWI